ncbi:MAG: TetR family transcriptional regulator [Reinekea sp.]
MTTFGKRELNKAQTRLDILTALYELSEQTPFRDLKVKAIAEAAAITEMTFFNYFQKKEDILKYMMGIWALDLVVLQSQQPLMGEAAIRRIFSHTATQSKKYPRLMVNFIASLASNEIDPAASNIELTDRYLLYPDLPETAGLTIPSGNEMILKHLSEIDINADHTATLLHLASSFYGDPLIAYTSGLDLEMLYTSSLNLIFGLSQ